MKKILTTAMALASFSAFAGGSCVDTNLDVWSEQVLNGGEVAVSANSAMGGTSCGLDIVYLSDTGKGYVGDTNATNEQRYRAAMCIDPNSIALPLDGVGGKMKIHNAQCTDGTCANNGLVQFKIQSDGATGYEIRGFVRDSNSNANKNKFTVALADEPSRVEYDFDMTAGTFKLWVDAASDSETPVIDLDTLDTAAWSGGVSRSRLGSLSNPANVTPGADKVLYIDEFESRRQTFIGGTCN